MHTKKIIEAGLPLSKAKKALIMIHGRGARAEDILGLRHEFSLDEFYVVAPQATNSTWYPYSFLAPVSENEPWLSSAIALLYEIVSDIVAAGISPNRIYLLGFSQGACLTLEFAARYAQPWGGVMAFTGGLIGEHVERERYTGNFDGAEIFIGTSDIDPHVPLDRSEESRVVLEALGAKVTLKVYPGMAHTINRDELEVVKKIFFPQE